MRQAILLVRTSSRTWAGSVGSAINSDVTWSGVGDLSVIPSFLASVSSGSRLLRSARYAAICMCSWLTRLPGACGGGVSGANSVDCMCPSVSVSSLPPRARCAAWTCASSLAVSDCALSWASSAAVVLSCASAGAASRCSITGRSSATAPSVRQSSNASSITDSFVAATASCRAVSACCCSSFAI